MLRCVIANISDIKFYSKCLSLQVFFGILNLFLNKSVLFKLCAIVISVMKNKRHYKQQQLNNED
jgi:hypothetical protein